MSLQPSAEEKHSRHPASPFPVSPSALDRARMASHGGAHPSSLIADYVVVGAGAMGLAFADALLSESPTATVVLVERNDRPGGHWQSAYPFVRLHQPAQIYGVNSIELARGTVDSSGPNAGLESLSTGHELRGYWERVVDEGLLQTGRCTALFSHDYDFATCRARSLVTGESVEIKAAKVVDASYYTTVTSAMKPPSFTVAPDVTCIPPNELPREASVSPPHFCVIGGGKTAIDSVCWLRSRGVAPAKITWTFPRDSWFICREALQVQQNIAETMKRQGLAGPAIAACASAAECLEKMDEIGVLARLAPDIVPSMYHCACVSSGELTLLRSVTDVVRGTKVAALTPTSIRFEDGREKELPAGTVFVDCTAQTLAPRPKVPVFQGGKIVLQPVSGCQQVFSAALIGYLEARGGTDETKNALCGPVPHPEVPLDFLRIRREGNANLVAWMRDPALVVWLGKSRLFLLRYMFPFPADEVAAAAFGPAVAAALEAELPKLDELMAGGL
ncbi:pyridine nucleotide-disulfide oxidoreductase-domain-containing protein, partial [Hyaloraphidium curvatum]